MQPGSSSAPRSADPPPFTWQPPPPPQLPPLWQRVEQVASINSLVFQALIWRRTWSDSSLQQHLHQALQAVLYALWVAFAYRAPPPTWFRCRVAMLTLLRLATASVPSVRSAHEGTAVLLGQPATPGLHGLVQDYFCLTVGTRVLPNMAMGAGLHQPPLAVLLQQCAVMFLAANNAGYCRRPLLSSRLSRRRLARVWAALLAYLPSFASPGLSGPPRSLLRCTAILNMHQLTCGILLPTLVAAWTWQQPGGRLGAAQGAPLGRQQRGQGGQQQQQQQQQHVRCVKGRALAAARLAAHLWAALNARLHRVCHGEGLHWVYVLAFTWLMVGNLWTLAVLAATRSTAGHTGG